MSRKPCLAKMTRRVAAMRKAHNTDQQFAEAAMPSTQSMSDYMAVLALEDEPEAVREHLRPLADAIRPLGDAETGHELHSVAFAAEAVSRMKADGIKPLSQKKITNWLVTYIEQKFPDERRELNKDATVNNRRARGSQWPNLTNPLLIDDTWPQ